MDKPRRHQYSRYALSVIPFAMGLWLLYGKTNHDKPRQVSFRAVDEVPIEIWREIMAHFCDDHAPPLRDKGLHDRGTCRCDGESHFGWPFDRIVCAESKDSVNNRISEHQEERSLYREAYRAKLRIAKVSRMHWKVAQEFLCRDLCIYDVDSAFALADWLTSWSSFVQRSARRWTRQLRINIIGTQIEDVHEVTDALTSIIYCCPELRSLSIRILPEPTGDVPWSASCKVLTRYIPRNIECLDVSFSLLQSECSLPVEPIHQYESDVEPMSFPHLSTLRAEGIQGPWTMSTLTHLYITQFEITDTLCWDFWFAEKPRMSLLHLGSEAHENRYTFALLLSGMPNLRIFEYYYINPWPVDAWTVCQSLSPLTTIKVKTFVDDDPLSSILFRHRTTENWTHFCNHLRPLFVRSSGTGSKSKCEENEKGVSIMVILPRFKDGCLGRNFVTEYFENIRTGNSDCPGSLHIVVKDVDSLLGE